MRNVSEFQPTHTHTHAHRIRMCFLDLSVCFLFPVIIVVYFQIQFADSFNPFAFENYNFFLSSYYVYLISIAAYKRVTFFFLSTGDRKKRPVE